MTKILNLRTGEWQAYSCSPRSAVIAAHAQSRGDWNTWNYKDRYDHMVESGQWHLFCGDFGTRSSVNTKEVTR